MLKNIRIIIFLILSAVSIVSVAQNSAIYKPKFTEGIALVVTAGDYSVRFAERMSWTFRDITFKGKKINATSGAQQPVLNEFKTAEGVDKFLGTGHRKEQIESFEIIVLDKKKKVIAVHPVQEGLNITEGDSFIVHKKSNFYSEFGGLYYKHESKITVSNDGVHQDYSFIANADDYSNVNFMYAFMHIFPKSTTSWIVGDNEKVFEKGEFLSDKSFTLKKDFRFCLVHNPTEKFGLAIVYPEVYIGSGLKNAFWNREYDNKHYLRMDPAKVKGEKFRYAALIKAFETDGSPSNFELQGKTIVDKEVGKSVKF